MTVLETTVVDSRTMPPFSLDATLMNIHIKLIQCQNACIFAGDNVGIFIQKFVVNYENTSIFETIVLNGPSVSSKVTDFGKN